MDKEQQLRILEEIYGKVEEGKAVLMEYSTSSDLEGRTVYTLSVIDAATGVSYTASSYTGSYINNVKVVSKAHPLPNPDNFKDYFSNYNNIFKTDKDNNLDK